MDAASGPSSFHESASVARCNEKRAKLESPREALLYPPSLEASPACSEHGDKASSLTLITLVDIDVAFGADEALGAAAIVAAGDDVRLADGAAVAGV